MIIDAVAIDVPVQPVGVEPDGQMTVPGSVGNAGWYRFGARPADRRGTTVIAGHVDSRREGLGPFARLASVARGSTVVVIDSDRRRHRYRVVELTRIRQDGADLTAVFDRDGGARLQLITCAGAYDSRTGYRDYLVVTAVPV